MVRNFLLRYELYSLLIDLTCSLFVCSAGGQSEDSRNTGQGERNGRDSEAASGSSESRRPLWLDFLADLSAYTAHLLEETSESFLVCAQIMYGVTEMNNGRCMCHCLKNLGLSLEEFI